MRSFKSNENIHKKEGGSYYVVSANKASSVTLQLPGNESQRKPGLGPTRTLGGFTNFVLLKVTGSLRVVHMPRCICKFLKLKSI